MSAALAALFFVLARPVGARYGFTSGNILQEASAATSCSTTTTVRVSGEPVRPRTPRDVYLMYKRVRAH